jgi:solute carrier family 25 carnitine/acylcarnitine transporter 20/29
MTHNEKRSHWIKEGSAALITGVLYGISNVLVGHPLDTIKTKIQTLKSYEGKGVAYTINSIYKSDGLKGFYRGCIPPLMGSSIFRALQFAVFEALFTRWEHSRFMKSEIPFTSGLQLRVLCGGICAGTVRSIIECPFEYTKVQGQIGQKWNLSNLYQGFKLLWLRNTCLMTYYFMLVDYFRRNTNAYKSKYLLFFMNGLCATLAFSLVWPLEIVKNQIQSKKSTEFKKYSITMMLKENINKYGLFDGLTRGSLPGLSSVFLRNGAAMIVMNKAQSFLTKIGWRD